MFSSVLGLLYCVNSYYFYIRHELRVSRDHFPLHGMAVPLLWDTLGCEITPKGTKSHSILNGVVEGTGGWSFGLPVCGKSHVHPEGDKPPPSPL